MILGHTGLLDDVRSKPRASGDDPDDASNPTLAEA